MTTGTAIQKAKLTPQLPAAMLETLNREAIDIKDRLGAPSGDTIIVTPNKTFRMPGLEQEAPEISAVIVDWVTLNQFYEGSYDKNNIQPPVCVALGAKEKEMIPFDAAPKPQHADCLTCPKNQYGSAGKGSKGKACKNQRLLAVLSPTDQEKGPLMLLKVSPTAIRYFDKYVSMVTQSGIQVPHPMAIITMISFDPNSSFPSLRFKVGDSNPNVELSFARRKEARERLLSPPTFAAKAA